MYWITKQPQGFVVMVDTPRGARVLGTFETRNAADTFLSALYNLKD